MCVCVCVCYFMQLFRFLGYVDYYVEISLLWYGECCFERFGNEYNGDDSHKIRHQVSHLYKRTREVHLEFCIFI